MVREAFAPDLLRARTRWIEPAWKMLLANKAVLAALWARFPGHPNLLPAYRTPQPLAGLPHVVKPMLSREGANVRLVRPGHPEVDTGGPYGAEGLVWQAYAPMPVLDGFTPVLGVWMVGDDACGMGIREDCGPITRNSSFFVPHYFN
jgi:glutathionylspermidine synthase